MCTSRLNSKNSHQVPRVVMLCGSHQQGSLGLNTARQLHTHDLLTTVLTPAGVAAYLPFTHELKLYQLTGGDVAHSTAQLDANTAIDLILDARLDHKGCPGKICPPLRESTDLILDVRLDHKGFPGKLWSDLSIAEDVT